MMSSRRKACCLFSGLLICMGGSGCTSLDSFIGSGITMSTPSERLLPIAQVFERQGRLEEAAAIYRKTLHAEPGNATAIARLSHIEQLSRPRTFEGGGVDKSADMQIARNSVKRSATKTAEPEEVASTEDTTATVSVFGPGRTVVEHEIVASTEDAIATVSVFGPESSVVDSESVVDSDDDSEPVRVRFTDMTPAFAISSSSGESGYANFTLSGHTETTEQSGPEHILEWMDSPAEHVEQLLWAVKESPDAETQTLAAAALAEVCNQREVAEALERACRSPNVLLAATACDALLGCEPLNDQAVDRLFELSEDSDPDIRSMVIASLRSLSGTEWSGAAVQTLSARLHDPDANVRNMAALTLGDLVNQGETALKSLSDRYEIETEERVLRSIEQATERLHDYMGGGPIAFGVALPYADESVTE